MLGMADAALGHKEDAIREGRRAVELLPVTKDAIIGARLVQNLALIYAWTGEKDLAFEQLAIAASIPGYLSYGESPFAPVPGIRCAAIHVLKKLSPHCAEVVDLQPLRVNQSCSKRCCVNLARVSNEPLPFLRRSSHRSTRGLHAYRSSGTRARRSHSG